METFCVKIPYTLHQKRRLLSRFSLQFLMHKFTNSINGARTFGQNLLGRVSESLNNYFEQASKKLRVKFKEAKL